MNHYRIKYWLYKQDQWIISILVILLTVITTIALIDVSRNGDWIKVIEFRVWVAIIVGLITLLFAFMRQKHNDMSVFFQLFEKFNNRYDELNSFLNAINKITSDTQLLENHPREHPFEVVGKHMKEKFRERLFSRTAVENVLDDYLNLCAEEHLAYMNGYIPPSIMKYWYNGMEVFFKNGHLRSYFEKELDNDSYYEFKGFAKQQFNTIEANEA